MRPVRACRRRRRRACRTSALLLLLLLPLLPLLHALAARATLQSLRLALATLPTALPTPPSPGRLGIFVDGTLVTIGNPKELSARYGAPAGLRGAACCCPSCAACKVLLCRRFRLLPTGAAPRRSSPTCPPPSSPPPAPAMPLTAPPNPTPGGYYVFSITVPIGQEAAAEALVRRLSPGARLTYAIAGTRKYELPTDEVALPAVFEAMAGAKAQGLTVQARR